MSFKNKCTDFVCLCGHSNIETGTCFYKAELVKLPKTFIEIGETFYDKIL